MSHLKQDFKELSIGQVLTSSKGIFRVTECIAMGRCCEVYQGEQLQFKKQVALKVFRRHQDYSGALQRELFFLRKLSAPGALVVEHFGELELEGHDILIQELLTCTLRDIFLSTDDGSCSPWFVLNIATDMLRGLDHMHKAGIIHADLKPPNIMWDAKSSSFKLIDFGVSFKATEEYTHTIQSRGYQAPECLKWNSSTLEQRHRTEERPGSASDIWSAGCIIFEAMTGSQFASQWSEVADTEETVTSRLTLMSYMFSGPFITEARNFLIRCLQNTPGRRLTAQELLSDMWLSQYYQPSFSDTSLLPTSIIRIMNLEDPNQTKSLGDNDMGCKVISLCQKYGQVKGHHFEPSLGYLYVCYEEPLAAELAQQSLSKMTVNDRMLVVTFYPLYSWTNQDYY